VCVVFRFNADGLIEAADFYWDQLTMLAQLGQQPLDREMAAHPAPAVVRP
jgi:hypothetical protein